MSGRVLDDRRRSVELHPGAEMVSNITGREMSDLERAVALAANILPILLPVGLSIYFVMTGRASIGGVICPAAGLLLLCLGVRGLIQRAVRPLAGLQLSLPTMMAHGYCGACGYRLAESPRGEDGCATCPECGAAWHTDRITFAQAKPEQTVAALRSAAQAGVSGGAGRLQMTTAFGFLDDRRVGLTARYCWPRGAFTSKVPSHAAEAKKALNKSLGLGVYVVLTVVWIGGAVIATAFWRSETTMTARLVPAAVIACACLFLHVLVRMAKLQADQVRSTVLQRRLCPSCWTPLEGRVEFDGCTACPKCRAAWRAADRGSTGAERAFGSEPPSERA